MLKTYRKPTIDELLALLEVILKGCTIELLIEAFGEPDCTPYKGVAKLAGGAILHGPIYDEVCFYNGIFYEDANEDSILKEIRRIREEIENGEKEG